MPPRGYKSTALPEDLINRVEVVVASNIGYIIDPVSTYPEKAYEELNCITLCEKCHWNFHMKQGGTRNAY